MSDLAEQMLNALTQPTKSGAVQLPPLAEQKLYLKHNLNTVDVDERAEIAHVIVAAGRVNMLNACSEGVVVDLNALPAEVISSMYSLLYYKIDR